MSREYLREEVRFRNGRSGESQKGAVECLRDEFEWVLIDLVLGIS